MDRDRITVRVRYFNVRPLPTSRGAGVQARMRAAVSEMQLRIREWEAARRDLQRVSDWRRA